MKTLVLLLVPMMICAAETRAQTGPTPTAVTRTMASLLAEGYEPQTVQIFKDRIWMRKPDLDLIAYICDRGRIGSPAFEAYRNRKYDAVQCSLAQ